MVGVWMVVALLVMTMVSVDAKLGKEGLLRTLGSSMRSFGKNVGETRPTTVNDHQPEGQRGEQTEHTTDTMDHSTA